MKAVLLAGGKGTRLRPYTHVLPKPLMPLGEADPMPIIEVVLRQLSRFGFRDVTIITGYLTELIEAFCGDGRKFGIRLQYRREETPLGTAGGLTLLKRPAEPVLVINGDILTTLSYGAMHEFHRLRGAAATIASYPREVKIDFGVLEFGDDPHVLTGYREKPEYAFQVSMGVYILDPIAWDFLTPGAALPMPSLLESMRAQGHPIHCYRQPCYWLDIGRHDDYATANEIFEARRAQFLGSDRPVLQIGRDQVTAMSSALPLLNDLLACLLGYLIGAIPFGYLVFYAARGIDIRTVGSGNIGATNVGRNLGFRYFLLVFALDVLKGFVPTAGLPLVLKRSGMTATVDSPVFIAIATVLGHNFPIYLGFKGGKGVATSLGALLALEPSACAAAVVGFFVPFFIWRYVSLSSICGALAFVAAHFLLVSEPWNREHRAMSVLSIAIAVLVVARHHKNIRRLLAGTEPKVSLRASRAANRTTSQPDGCVHRSLLFGLAVVILAIVGPALWLVRHARAPIVATAGPWSLRETHRELTGQQRCSRVVFADHGKTLAVLCPRYNKILLYRVTPQASLEPISEIAVEGRPMAIAAAGERIVVLERPANDDKHLQPGWWESFGLDGHKLGPRIAAGYYPDDLAVTPDGRLLLVLSSGQAEGDKDKPLPGVEVFSISFEQNAARPIGRSSLQPSDDPDRLWLSASGKCGLITLPKTKQNVAIDLSRPEAPTLAGRSALAHADGPYVSSSADNDWIIMPAAGEHEVVAMEGLNSPAGQGRGICTADYLIYTRPEQSILELVQVAPRCTIGQFPLRGPLNLAGTSPSGLAFSPERHLLAVTTKPGAVHLIAVHSRVAPEADWPKPTRAAMIKLSVDDDFSRPDHSNPLPR